MFLSGTAQTQILRWHAMLGLILTSNMVIPSLHINTKCTRNEGNACFGNPGDVLLWLWFMCTHNCVSMSNAIFWGASIHRGWCQSLSFVAKLFASFSKCMLKILLVHHHREIDMNETGHLNVLLLLLLLACWPRTRWNVKVAIISLFQKAGKRLAIGALLTFAGNGMHQSQSGINLDPHSRSAPAKLNDWRRPEI